MATKSSDIWRIHEQLIADDAAFMESMFEIPDKNQLRVPFSLKPAQAKMLKAIRDAGGYGRFLVVKPAQIGSTSFWTGLFLKRTVTTSDTTSAIVAHEDFLTQRLLQRAEVFYQTMPDIVRPEMDHKSAHEKRFPGINSVMYIGTARSAVFGRGEPIHNMLFSEAAFYMPGAVDKIVKPTLQRVPIYGTVVMESTPNGDDGYFYEQVQLALEGESSFQSIIVLYWWDEPDNYLPRGLMLVPERDRFDLEYTAEEDALIEQHSLTEGQIRWRRWKMRELDILFFQEHLESLDTCFMTPGLPYYDATTTYEQRVNIRPPSGKFEKADTWEDPQDGFHYVMGVDPGQAKITKSVATVWKLNGDAPEQVAELAGLIDTESMALQCGRLGRHYNSALAVPEANAHGIAFMRDFRGYPRVYMKRNLINGIPTLQPGWITGPSPKPFMMNELARRLPKMVIRSEELLRQIRGWRDLGNGRAATITADDYHDSACLSMVGAATVSSAGVVGRGFRGESGFAW